MVISITHNIVAKMTPKDLTQWILNLAPSNKEREKIIRDLIRNANGDQMSPSDREDCVKALKLLPTLPECRPAFHLNPLNVEPEEVH